jgi:radical SAM superfamily enzyme YgiQ (UPF0313 family)
MKTLLVRPRDPMAGTSFTRIRTLTLPSVAAEFQKVGSVRVVDEAVDPLPQEHFDLVGITSTTTYAPRAYTLADEFRARGFPVLLGGTHPTAMPEEALEHADAVVVGEVEGLAETIAGDLAAGRLAGRYQAPRPPDLRAVPVAPVDILPTYNQYFRPYPIELTRGCRHACRFCFNRTIHGAGFRRRDLDDLVDVLRERPERFLQCMDDNLMNDPEHVGAFAEKVAPLRRYWGAQATLTLAEDPALLSVLRDSGFSWTFVGLESFSRDSLAGESKLFNDVTRYRELFARLREYGILPFAGIMLGLDGDEPDVFSRTLDGLRDVAPAACSFTFPVPYPGTAFHARMEAEGRILCRDLTRYDGRHVVIRPARMSVDQLLAGYQHLSAGFFGWGAALARLAHILRLRTNLPRPNAIGGYLAITLGYRRFHRRLARQHVVVDPVRAR